MAQWSDSQTAQCLLRMWRVGRPIVVLVPATQLVVLLWVIWTKTPTTPYRDEWWYVSLVRDANQGALTFSDFWALHYHTHRIVISRLVDLSLIELTHWNRQVMMTVDLAPALAMGALLLVAVRRTTRSVGLTLALAIPLSLMVFSWAQYENWLAPFQLAFIATAFGTVVCAVALQAEHISRRRYALAIVGALIATCSSAAGLVVWLAFVPCLALAGYRRLLLWLALTAVVWAAYLYGFTDQFARPPLSSIPPFVLAFLGAPVAYPHPGRAEIVGLFAFVFLGGNLLVYWLLTRTLRPLLPWLSLALFSVATGVLAAGGRGANGAYGGVISRYQVFGALYWIAALVVCGVVVQQIVAHLAAKKLAMSPVLARGFISVSLLILVAVSASATLTNLIGIQEAVAQQAELVRDQQCIVHYQSAPDSCLVMWYPTSDHQAIRDAAAYLKAEKLAIFYTGSK
jgi:hypothetical protein